MTLVLLLKPGAHKVGVVGETTALELEGAGRAISLPSVHPESCSLSEKHLHLFKLKALEPHLQASSQEDGQKRLHIDSSSCRHLTWYLKQLLGSG